MPAHLGEHFYTHYKSTKFLRPSLIHTNKIQVKRTSAPRDVLNCELFWGRIKSFSPSYPVYLEHSRYPKKLCELKAPLISTYRPNRCAHYATRTTQALPSLTALWAVSLHIPFHFVDEPTGTECPPNRPKVMTLEHAGAVCKTSPSNPLTLANRGHNAWKTQLMA